MPSPELFTAIDVRGGDSTALLQGQLTADIEAISSGSVATAAWLNPKGRAIALFDIIRLNDGFRLFCASDLEELIVKRLTLYKLRSDVRIEVSNADIGMGQPPDPLWPTRALAADNTLEWFNPGDQSTKTPLDIHHLSARLASGLIWIDSQNSERFTAHQLNLDCSDTVSFSKGCYSGQEIVARTEHLGRIKRRACVFSVAQAQVDIGTKVLAAANACGEVICSAQTADKSESILVAVLPIDKHEAALTLTSGAALSKITINHWQWPAASAT